MNVRNRLWIQAVSVSTILCLLASLPSRTEARGPNQRGAMNGARSNAAGVGQLSCPTGDSRASATAQAATAGTQQTANSQLVTALKSAYTLLLQTGQDYSGHKTLAAQNVRDALAALSTRSSRKANSANSTNSTTNAATVAVKKKVTASTQQLSVQETQAASDAKMLQAKQILQQALTQMDVSRAKAATSVKAAIVEINAALSIQ
jgi:hypothetical protein